MKLLAFLVILGLLAVGIRLAVPHLGAVAAGGIVVLEHEGLLTLADCPKTSNCHRDEFPVGGEPAQAINSLAEIVVQEGGRIVSQDARYLHAIFTTRLMGFVDDVEFLLDNGNAGAHPQVLVRSASRLGESDLGANLRRVESLRSVSLGRL